MGYFRITGLECVIPDMNKVHSCPIVSKIKHVVILSRLLDILFTLEDVPSYKTFEKPWLKYNS